MVGPGRAGFADMEIPAGEEVRAIEHAFRWGLLALVVLALGYLGVGLFVATRLTTTDR
jgi:small-conductance mechanosensitive channel